MKKFLCVLFVILTVITSLMISVSAEDVVIKSILPNQDGQIIYTLYPAEHYIEPIYYYIKGYVTDSSATVDNPIPFVRTYHPNFDSESGTFSYELFDGQSSLLFNIYAGNTVTVTMLTTDLSTGQIRTYNFISSTDLVSYDYYLYVGSDGYIWLQKYNVDSNYKIGSPSKLELPLYGDIYIYNNIPSNNSSYTDGYRDGKLAGIAEGFSNGYDEGINDQKDIFNNSIGSIIDNAYDDGYDEGYIKGQADSASNSTDSQYWYNVGYLDGQNTNGIVEEGINGFWEGMRSFTTPFLDIGIGNLRVYSVLALVLIGALALLFIKLTRG